VGYQQLAAAGDPMELEKLLDEYTRLVFSHALTRQLPRTGRGPSG
jgi:hypothetical protein